MRLVLRNLYGESSAITVTQEQLDNGFTIGDFKRLYRQVLGMPDDYPLLFKSAEFEFTDEKLFRELKYVRIGRDLQPLTKIEVIGPNPADGILPTIINHPSLDYPRYTGFFPQSWRPDLSAHSLFPSSIRSTSLSVLSLAARGRETYISPTFFSKLPFEILCEVIRNLSEQRLESSHILLPIIEADIETVRACLQDPRTELFKGLQEKHIVAIEDVAVLLTPLQAALWLSDFPMAELIESYLSEEEKNKQVTEQFSKGFDKKLYMRYSREDVEKLIDIINDDDTINNYSCEGSEKTQNAVEAFKAKGIPKDASGFMLASLDRRIIEEVFASRYRTTPKTDESFKRAFFSIKIIGSMQRRNSDYQAMMEYFQKREPLVTIMHESCFYSSLGIRECIIIRHRCDAEAAECRPVDVRGSSIISKEVDAAFERYEHASKAAATKKLK